MQERIQIASIISMLAFFFYGFACIFNNKFTAEFERYGLPSFRVLTGILEVLGSLGLALGFYYPIFTTLASAGLSALMFCGMLVRIRIKDSLIQILPAFILFCLNLAICLMSIS